MSDGPAKSVSRFEANLLRLLRFFLKQVPAEQAMRLLNERLDRPPCLSANAVDLIKDSLSKGCVLYLVRAGAWKRDRFLRDGQAKFGRLWDRSEVELLTLEFSPNVVDFLMWLTAVRVRDERPVWSIESDKLTVADRLFFFLAYEAIRIDADLAATLRSSPVFNENALIWLMHPNDFASEDGTPILEPWLTEPGSLILEALQPVLETRWLELERSKGQVGDWSLLRQQGQVQARVLEALTLAVDASSRRDLVRFLMVVVARLLASPEMSSTFWTGGLQGAGPPRLAERLDTQRSALAVLRSVEQLRDWERQSRRSGYLDEDYALSQFWLSEYARYDFGTIAQRAERVLQQVEPLRMG